MTVVRRLVEAENVIMVVKIYESREEGHVEWTMHKELLPSVERAPYHVFEKREADAKCPHRYVECELVRDQRRPQEVKHIRTEARSIRTMHIFVMCFMPMLVDKPAPVLNPMH